MQSNLLKPIKIENSTFGYPLPVDYHAIAVNGHLFNGDEVTGKWPIFSEMAAAELWRTSSQFFTIGH